MLYTLKRRKNSITDSLLDGVSELCKNEYNLLNLKYRNELTEMELNCDLDLNDKLHTYKICFVSCDYIFGHIVKKYKTTDFVKVCYMIKFIKELVESADYYGEKETKNEILYKECINTICQYVNYGGKLDEFDGFCDDLPRKDI